VTPPLAVISTLFEREKTDVIATSAPRHVLGTNGNCPAKPVLSFIGLLYRSLIWKNEIVQKASTPTIQIEFHELFTARSVAIKRKRYNA